MLGCVFSIKNLVSSPFVLSLSKHERTQEHVKQAIAVRPSTGSGRTALQCSALRYLSFDFRIDVGGRAGDRSAHAREVERAPAGAYVLVRAKQVARALARVVALDEQALRVIDRTRAKRLGCANAY